MAHRKCEVEEIKICENKKRGGCVKIHFFDTVSSIFLLVSDKMCTFTHGYLCFVVKTK